MQKGEEEGEGERAKTELFFSSQGRGGGKGLRFTGVCVVSDGSDTDSTLVRKGHVPLPVSIIGCPPALTCKPSFPKSAFLVTKRTFHSSVYRRFSYSQLIRNSGRGAGRYFSSLHKPHHLPVHASSFVCLFPASLTSTHCISLLSSLSHADVSSNHHSPKQPSSCLGISNS